MRLSNLDLPSEICRTVGDILGRVGDKWAVFIIVMLKGGSLRFGELEKRIATVSKKMLTLTLRGLERDGYVTRTVTATVPTRVDYQLTDMGRDLLKPLDALANWALSHRTEVEAARQAFDAHHGAGPGASERQRRTVSPAGGSRKHHAPGRARPRPSY